MKRRPRIYYSASQRALMWEHWRKGETLHQIADCLIGITHRYTAFWPSPAGYARPSGTDQDWR